MPVTADEVKVLDGNSAFLGVPTGRLMENAGMHVAEVVKRKYKLLGKKVVVLCGTGNNGGDGFVAARHLVQYCQVQTILIRPPEELRTDITRANYEKVKRISTHLSSTSALVGILKNADIVIDALLGVGSSGEINEPYKSWIQTINKSGKPVVSVDVPSGFGGNVQVESNITVTFHDIKIGMDRKNSGEIIVVDIGIPKDAEEYVGPGEFIYYTIPHGDSHKGDNGRVLIVGGGPFTGAPALVGLGAYRIGADLVRLCVPKGIRDVVAKYSPNLIVMKLVDEEILTEKDVPFITQQLKISDSLVIGPGLGTAQATKKAIYQIIQKCECPILIDADAIGVIAEKPVCIKGKYGVITPHAGEFTQLTGKKLDDDIHKRKKYVSKCAEELGFTVLLKGKVDIISDGENTKLNRTGTPAMTVGGTGDVLSGIVGGLMAKGIAPFNAARIGAFASGYAGELAFREKSWGLLATDVVEKVPEVLREFIK